WCPLWSTFLCARPATLLSSSLLCQSPCLWSFFSARLLARLAAQLPGAVPSPSPSPSLSPCSSPIAPPQPVTLSHGVHRAGPPCSLLPRGRPATSYLSARLLPRHAVLQLGFPLHGAPEHSGSLLELAQLPAAVTSAQRPAPWVLALLAAILLDPLHGARSSRVSSSTALSSASNWVLLCPGRRSQSLVDRAPL
uniref:Uncharacterized protein n=2 Tax=Zea mays TaxID=4577 RepID=A0A804Q1Q0_MAIZE